MQTVLFGVHSYTILVLLEAEKFDVSAFSQNFMIFAATVFFVLNYAYFSRHGRLKKILARYESSSQKVGWFVPVYVVIAIAVFLAAVAFKDYRP
jgi:hypothetical protein